MSRGTKFKSSLCAHDGINTTTLGLRDWRKQDEQLAVVAGPAKGLGATGFDIGGMDMEEVAEAYGIMKQIDFLDVPAGAPSFGRTAAALTMFTFFFRGLGNLDSRRGGVQ